MLVGIEDEEVGMAGHLELVETPDGGEFRILMVDGDDVLMGLSKRFASVDEAVEGVAAIREVAGDGTPSHLDGGAICRADVGGTCD